MSIEGITKPRSAYGGCRRGQGAGYVLSLRDHDGVDFQITTPDRKTG